MAGFPGVADEAVGDVGVIAEEADEVVIRAASDLPLRVLSIKETLASGKVCFHTPVGWNFHIISHTWSKGLRDLSLKIGEKVASHAGNYNDAFLEEDFQEEPSFEALLRFLDLLYADGVETIWIDALCINQTDMVEKSREIARMAEYYRNSMGCYVLTHGIDQGYKMFKTKNAVPRWFERVWTLQEFLLPTALYFIVSDYNPRVISHANMRVREWGSLDVGVCRCAFILDNVELMKLDGGYESAFIMGTRECQKCRSTSLIRELHMSPNSCRTRDEMQPVYMVERSAYLWLAHLECMQAQQLHQGGWSKQGELLQELVRRQRQEQLLEPDQFHQPEQQFQQWRQGLKILEQILQWGKGVVFSPRLVMAELGNRECLLEEDRVLSILGLLKAQHTRQLRAGKTLREQVIDLAKGKLQLGEQDFLIHMMTMDVAGCDSMGDNLSWAPDFKTSKKRLTGFFELGLVKRCVELLEVTDEGKVRLKGAKIARVRMSAVNTSPQQPFKMAYLLPRCRGGPPFPGGFSIVAKNPTKVPTFEFDVWFLLLATLGVVNDQGVVLMCLRCADNDANDFRKIGLLVLGAQTTKLVYQDSLPCVSCSLAGCAGALEDGYFDCSLPLHPALKWALHDDKIPEWLQYVKSGICFPN